MDIKQIEEAKRFLSSKPEDISKEFVRNLVYYFGVYYGEMLGNIYGYHKAKCKVRDAFNVEISEIISTEVENFITVHWRYDATCGKIYVPFVYKDINITIKVDYAGYVMLKTISISKEDILQALVQIVNS